MKSKLASDNLSFVPRLPSHSVDQPKLGSIVRIKRNTKAIVVRLLLTSILLSGCTRAPLETPPTAPAPAPPPVTLGHQPIDAALPALIFAERTAAHERDLATLAQLWAEDARIVDSRGTNDPAAAYTWQGRDAILDRYMLAVFPAPPPPLTAPPELTLAREGDSATATVNNDHWRFIFAEGRWWLQELNY